MKTPNMGCIFQSDLWSWLSTPNMPFLCSDSYSKCSILRQHIGKIDGLMFYLLIYLKCRSHTNHTSMWQICLTQPMTSCALSSHSHSPTIRYFSDWLTGSSCRNRTPSWPKYTLNKLSTWSSKRYSITTSTWLSYILHSASSNFSCRSSPLKMKSKCGKR